jgi:hypothetical protein
VLFCHLKLQNISMPIPKQASEIGIQPAVKIDKEIFNENGLKEPRK